MSVLLLGNGINQAEGLSPNWNQLLRRIAREYSFVPEESLSNTLGYEMLENQILRKNPGLSVADIHRKIADGVETGRMKKKTDWRGTVHDRLMELPVHTVLTTNYDYALERSVAPSFRHAYHTRETTYSLRRFQRAGDKTVYHIHGECGYPRSICLGFEHYAGSLQRIREGIVSPTALTEQAKQDGHTYMLADILKGLTPKPQTGWIYDFFTEDLYILGLNLDACEIDLWWLLSYRAKQRAMEKLTIPNEIHYLDVSIPNHIQEEERIRQRKRLLEVFDVHYVACRGDAYPEKYDHACKWLKRKLK